MSIPLGTSGVSSWGFSECSMSGVILTQLLEGSCVSMASYGLVMAKQGTGSSIFIHMVQEFWKVWFMYLGELVNLGWIVQYVLVETLIQMMHLRRAHTVFLMIWNILWLEGLGGQQLSAVVVTLYKIKLASGLAVFRLSLMTPKAWSYALAKLGFTELITFGVRCLGLSRYMCSL